MYTRVATLILSVGVTPALLAAQSGHFSIPGNRVGVYDLIGTVSVVAGTGDAVEVTVTRGGADGSRLRVETGPIRGEQTLRVMFPGNAFRYRENGSTTLRVREDGTFGDGMGLSARRVRIGDEGLDAFADLRVEVPAGKSITIHVGVGRITATNLNGSLRLNTAAGNVRADRITGSLEIETGSGNVAARTIRGDLDIETGSGDVEVRDVSGGRVDLETGSGDITGATLQGSMLSVETGSGNIELDGVTAPTQSHETGSGDITLGLASDVDELSIETGSGNVTLKVPPAFGAEVSVETSSGDVDTDIPLTITRRSDDRLTGRIGDGQGQVSIETGSGSVRFRPAER